MCRYLLEEAGADPRRGHRGPLHCAIWNNGMDAVRMLLQRGADPNLYRRPSSDEENDDRRGWQRYTDLAIEEGYIEILALLL
jgi:ankyrin repeat protein